VCWSESAIGLELGKEKLSPFEGIDPEREEGRQLEGSRKKWEEQRMEKVREDRIEWLGEHLSGGRGRRVTNFVLVFRIRE